MLRHGAAWKLSNTLHEYPFLGGEFPLPLTSAPNAECGSCILCWVLQVFFLL